MNSLPPRVISNSHITKEGFMVREVTWNDNSPVKIHERDVFAGLEICKEWDLDWIFTSRKLQTLGYWKTASWIENNRASYEIGLLNGFEYAED